jgi:hypothetical protein
MWNAETPSSLEKVKCPVCQGIIGSRNPSDRIWARCEECKAAFYFSPFKDVPTRGSPDSHIGKSQCNCGRCGH